MMQRSGGIPEKTRSVYSQPIIKYQAPDWPWWKKWSDPPDVVKN